MMRVSMAVAASTESMPLARMPQTQSLSAVRAWIYSLAVLVVLMVAVGGATRLTGSGLSITEWKPVTGAIPPLSEQAWMVEFEKYRQISQYELVNKGMTLSEFKFIYGWEWGHRQLGRLIGLVFFLPLVWFWARGVIGGRLALGGLVAGSKAGLTYNTWPLMDGALVPPASALFVVRPWIENFVDNVALVQFNHRLVAYAIVAFAVWHAWTIRRQAKSSRTAGRATGMAGLTLAQMALGIVTLLLA